MTIDDANNQANENLKVEYFYDGNGQRVKKITDSTATFLLSKTTYYMGSSNPIDILSYADYFPFGWQMPGRNQQGDYRYAYQGQEKDPETGWEAFERMHPPNPILQALKIQIIFV